MYNACRKDANKFKFHVDNLEASFLPILEKLRPKEVDVRRLGDSYCAISQMLAIILENHFIELEHKPNYKILMYGSAINATLSSQDSDLDITIIFDQNDIDQWNIMEVIRTNYRRINDDQFKGRFKCGKLLQTKAGLVLEFDDNNASKCVNIEITINKICEVYNSHLINTYARIEKRFVDLSLLLKAWNKKSFKDRTKRINSYSLNLMIIAFLQNYKLLPYLQSELFKKGQTSPHTFQKQVYSKDSLDYDGIINTDILFEQDLVKISENFTPDERNRQPDDPNNTVTALLMKFFYTYLYLFDSENFAITPGLERAFSDKQTILGILQSLHTNDAFVEKNLLKDFMQYGYMILDPFDTTYNPAKALKLDSQLFYKYQDEMYQTLYDIFYKSSLDRFKI